MAEVVTHDAPENLTTQPWMVGFFGPFRVLTRLDDQDREIDVDDRAAILNIIIEMMDTSGLDLVARNVVVTLFFNFAGETDANGEVLKARYNILFNGRERGPLVLVGGPGDAPVEIQPNVPLERQVTINTGLFSSTNTPKDAGSATPGRKMVDVKIDYELEPRNPIEEMRTNAQATMQFVVARD